MSKRRLGRLCTALGTVCILLSLGLLLYDRSQELQAQRITQELAPALEEAIAQRARKRREAPPLDQEEPAQPEITLNGEVYLGLLSIPALELELPVRRDRDDRRPVGPHPVHLHLRRKQPPDRAVHEGSIKKRSPAGHRLWGCAVETVRICRAPCGRHESELCYFLRYS